MNAESNIRSQVPIRPAGDVAEHWREGWPAYSVIATAKTFKKTPSAAALQPVGPDVAQDIAEITSIPLLTTTLLDLAGPVGDTITGTTPAVAENLTTVEGTHHSAAGLLASVQPGDGDIVAIGACAGIPDENLTENGVVARKSNRAARATNIPAVSGAASHVGGVHEKRCYADI